MRMTTKGKFAVTAMTDLARTSSGVPVSLAEISLRQKISLSYLEQLFGKLRRNGLVRSIRGPGGGYVLAREVESISVADIVAAVDDITDSGPGGMQALIPEGSTRCDTSGLWHDVSVKMNELLGSISLKILVDKELADGLAVRDVRVRRGISSEPVVKPIRTSAPNSVFALGSSLVERRKVT